jgi:hypothetical protein
MVNFDPTGYGLLDASDPALLSLAVLVALWKVVWKGLGLWQAARAGHKGWFVAILIINTLGILPIIYLVIQRSKQNKKLP